LKKRLHVRIWKLETREFAAWLQENIDVMNNELGLQPGFPNREKSTESFNIDLAAEDEFGNTSIKENQ